MIFCLQKNDIKSQRKKLQKLRKFFYENLTLISSMIFSFFSLLQVKHAHPEISFADLYTAAGVFAIEFLGGPKVHI